MNFYPLCDSPLEGTVRVSSRLEVGEDYPFQRSVYGLSISPLPNGVRKVVDFYGDDLRDYVVGWLTSGQLSSIDESLIDDGCHADTRPYAKAALAYFRALPPDVIILVEVT